MSEGDMKLSHFSSTRIGDVRPPDGPQPDDADKPYGFWVSVDGEDDWESWCVAEDFRSSCLSIRHRVTLAPRANILHLMSAGEVHSMRREYPGNHAVLRGINWRAVAAKYDGIIIAPYQWSCRLADGCGWYYGWDCASGCIWRPRAVDSIEVIADLQREAA